MDADLFLADLQDKPTNLRALASRLRDENPWRNTPAVKARRCIFVGMGSSHFANAIVANRLQAEGRNGVAILASTTEFPAVTSDDVVVFVSASGSSPETLAAAQHYAAVLGTARCVAVTNTDESALDAFAAHHVDMRAGKEAGGVACRSFQHTLALHLALLEGGTTATKTAGTVDRAADATSDLLDRKDSWAAPLAELLFGPDGTALVAPVSRLSSAQQGALMVREGPRLPAIACETGDWSHIDVYLTKTTDYRMLLFTGSPWESELLRWCRERHSTVVALGGTIDDAAYSLRYLHDDIADVALLTEVFVPELLAAERWRSQR